MVYANSSAPGTMRFSALSARFSVTNFTTAYGKLHFNFTGTVWREVVVEHESLGFGIKKVYLPTAHHVWFPALP